ncbi:hypothetical protein M8J77_018252 [Diaphorina citri]|nr:hypothetical protein M8J77_018252 [Diaphorina citri]
MSTLDTLKKDRAVLRASITKAHKKVMEVVEKGEDSKSLPILIELLRLRYETLSSKDSEVIALLTNDDSVTEAALCDEQEKVDEYFMKYQEALQAASRVLGPDPDLNCKQEVEPSEAGSNQSYTIKKYKLPTLKLREFGGELKDWLPFWSQFEKIDQDTGMADVDKLGYLTMSMSKGSSAEQLVLSYPATGKMYGAVVQALKDRFGRIDLLTEFYIRQLLKIILENSKDKLSVSALYDSLQSHLRNLEMLDISKDNCAAILLPLVSSCISQDLLQTWERQAQGCVSTKDRLENILEFLRAETERDQKLALAMDGFGMNSPVSAPRSSKPKVRQTEGKTIPTASTLVNDSNNTPVKVMTCIFCKGTHNSQDCKKAQSMSMAERRDCVNKTKACYCCLRPGHRGSYCRSRPKCNICKKGHFPIMCTVTVTQDQVLTNNLQCSVPVVMQTLTVCVRTKNSQLKRARILIDSGSQKSYVLEKLVNDMDCKPIRKENIQHSLFGGSVTDSKSHNVYLVDVSKLDLSYQCTFEALDQPKICGPIASVPKGPWIAELSERNIVLPDLGNESEISILIGSDIAAKLYTGNIVHLSSGLVAMETHLGWTISGKVPGVTGVSSNMATLVTNLFVKEASISDLWSLDVIGITDPTERKSKADLEKATHDHFNNTVKVNEVGRFEVRLPFLKDHPPISENYDLSLRRLQSTLKKLEHGSYREGYGKVLEEWQKAGIIEEVPLDEQDKPAHYLPHHHVIKPGSTTPIRPVFDASAKEMGKCSLNECLDSGPNLIEKIPSALAKFRQRKIGVSGDITKAFLQISVAPNDRDFLRFLWQTTDGQLKVFRHCRVLFGASPSPFLLEACINLHIDTTLSLCKEGKSNYSIELLELLKNSFYVDNCLASVDNIEQAQSFITLASSVMIERGFELRGWEKSGDQVDKTTNVLGLVWDRYSDTLAINTERLSTMKFDNVTKKIMLSAAHRLFDPLGIISPVVLIPKILLQQTWKENLSWNEAVNEDIKTKFQQWLDEIHFLEEVKVERWVRTSEPVSQLELHVFSDASQCAYATVIFIVVRNENDVSIHLLASKARVSPTTKTKKGMTIPRLELLGALIAARLYATVVEDYKLHDVRTIFWTDATTVLAWLLRKEPWDVFVHNRVQEICKITANCEWRHVPGEHNPADLPSRGCTPKKLLQCRWWEGPSWLKEPEERWPVSEVKFDESEINTEKKRTVVSSMICTEKLNWYKYFSKFKQVVNMIGWILRFKNNCDFKKKNGHLPENRKHLSVEEYKIAEEKVFWLCQQDGPLDMDKLKHLSIIPTDNGLIRLKTKISNREDENDFCHPILLPGKHPVVQRLIFDIHTENCHAGTQMLLSILRQRFWITGGRRTIRSILKSCVVCQRFTSKNIQTPAIPLPIDRVRDAKVFEISGVDLAGPLFVKDDKGSLKKVWICLFTCAVYRAVRLELVFSLSTDSFIMALRRFIAKNGRPSIIYSDNGSNFTCFKNVCDKLDWDTIASYSTARKIEWRLIPPSSPWWGGWWERLVGVMKSVLKKILGRACVDTEVLQTILGDCESIMNQRPLTYLSEDPSDLAVLTPAMFLNEIQEVGVPEWELIQPTDLRKRYAYRQELVKALRERFRAEYLGQLQLFSNKASGHSIKVGDIVLIGDDNVKRIDWPVGLVIELIKGRDMAVRVVRVRTINGVVTRSVQRIYPLEFHLDSDSKELACESVIPDIGNPNNSLSEVKSPKRRVARQVKVVVKKPQSTRCGRVITKPLRFD